MIDRTWEEQQRHDREQLQFWRQRLDELENARTVVRQALRGVATAIGKAQTEQGKGAPQAVMARGTLLMQQDANLADLIEEAHAEVAKIVERSK